MCVTAPGFGLLSGPRGSSLSLTSLEYSSVAISLICRWHLVLFPSHQPRQEISLYFPATGRDRELDGSQESGLIPELQTALQWLAWKQILRIFYSGIHLFKCFIPLGLLIALNCSTVALWCEELWLFSSANKSSPSARPRPWLNQLISARKERVAFSCSLLLITPSQSPAALCSSLLGTSVSWHNWPKQQKQIMQ